MIKTVIKEIMIILLLCIAILLLLSVLFYEYNPLGKVIPSEIAYEVPETVKSDLEDSSEPDEELTIQNIVYTVEGSDLNIYKKSKSYVPGKANPFASSVVNNTNSVNNVSNTQGDSSSSTTTQQDTNTSSEKKTSSTEDDDVEINDKVSKQKSSSSSESTENTFWEKTGSK